MAGGDAEHRRVRRLVQGKVLQAGVQLGRQAHVARATALALEVDEPRLAVHVQLLDQQPMLAWLAGADHRPDTGAGLLDET